MIWPKISATKLLWFFFYALIFSLVLNHSSKVLDTDYGWHWRFGQQIAATQQAPQQQIYMWTLPGQTWVDHEWLSNLLLYWGQTYLGYWALNIIFALIIVGSLALVAWYLKKHYLSRAGHYSLMAWQLLGVVAMLPHLGVRIQEIALLFLALLLIIIDSQQRAWTQHKYLAYTFIPLICLWANLHASFLLGLAVWGWWLAIQLLTGLSSAWRQNPVGHSHWQRTRHTTWALILGGLATLINPYGWQLYDFLFGYTNNAYLTMINEWLPSFYLPLPYWQLLFSALAVSLLLINFPWRLLTKKFLTTQQEQNFWRLSLLLIFLFLANKSIRHFPLFFIVALFNLAPLALANPAPTIVKKITTNRWLTAFMLLVSACLITLSLIFTHRIDQPQIGFCRSYPCQTVDFLRQHEEYWTLKTFNHYNYGGYLIWTLPELPLFIDGRLPQYPYNNHSILEEYADFMSSPTTLRRKLTDNDIKLVVWPSQAKGRRYSWLDKLLFAVDDTPPRNLVSEALENQPEWQLIFQGPVGMIYLRRD